MKLKVNGKVWDVEAELDTPLLWVLRDGLQLRGTKFGCGKGLCGACTVHLNGRAVRSCQMTLSAVKDAEVRTIEGLSVDGSHPVQVAWRDHNVPQCGYCQPGQIMTAAAFLAENASPSDEQIDSAMSGNLCRCGTYPRIRAAVQQAAGEGES
ncbi:MAG: (2Fe-2S)-binding protein [Halioglobus sp.]